MERNLTFTMSVDAQHLYERLIETTIGEFVSYNQLLALIGRDVQNSARGCLNTAMRRAMREHSMHFGVERGSGIVRLSDEQAVQSTQKDLRSIHRKARRTREKLSHTDYGALSDQIKVEHNARMSVAGALEMITAPRAQKKIEAGVLAAKRVLPLAETLEHFRR